MNFNKEIWQAEIRTLVTDLPKKAVEWGVESIFGLCIAATLWPALEALRSGDVSAIMAIGTVIGSDLIKDHLLSLKNKPKEEQPNYLAKLLEEDQALRQDVQKLLVEFDTLSMVINESSTDDRAWLEEKLKRELDKWDKGIRIEGNLEKGFANTGDFNTFHVSIVEKQEIHHNYFSTPNPLKVEAEREEIERQHYLRQLHKHCQDLLLVPLGEEETSAATVKLDDVYIDPNTTTPRSNQKDKKTANNLIEHRDRDVFSAMEVAQKYDRLVILGDAGSGKSTFAKRLLGLIAHCEYQGDKGLTGIPAGLLPVLVNLRDLVPALQKTRLSDDTQQRKSALAELVMAQAAADVEVLYKTPEFAGGIHRAITSGACYLVLDGFDEVPQNMRGLMREVVAALLTFDIQRILVTCRIRSYSGKAVLEAFSAHTLADLTTEQINKFCQDWYHRQSEMGRVLIREHDNKADDFFQAATGDEKLRELAGNPMLLTCMAIVHQKETHLPPERVKLFQKVVIILLFRWQKHHGNQHVDETLQALLKDEDTILRAIEHLAYEAHRVGKGGKEAADLPYKQARDILEKNYIKSADLAGMFLDYVDQRSGILNGRGGEPGKPISFAFPHRFLQEYLAGCYLAGAPDADQMVDQFMEIASEGDFWDVAALLAFEELKYNRPTSALRTLAFELLADPVLEKSCHHRLIFWSGQIANLIGKASFASSRVRGEAYLENLQPSLLKVAQGIQLNPVERAESANALDGLGYKPEDLYEFVKIPGDTKLLTFWLGKYPVTNLQYERFLALENFQNEELWCHFPDYDHKGNLIGDTGDEGWQWLQRLLKNKSQVVLYPRYWNDLRFGNSPRTAPVVGISWYEVNAYCHWLGDNWQTLSEAEKNPTLQPGAVCLPLETEWKKAAGGTANDRFPWDKAGAESDRETALHSANTTESGIGRKTPVWTYPQGKSLPFELYDMAGNVWEWQSNKSDKDSRFRVLQGGSFNSYQDDACCAFRGGGIPVNRVFDIGFRLCLRP